MSRRPLPTAIKKARGNPGKRPLNDAEPATVAGRPEPPKMLKGEALVEFNRLCDDLENTGVRSATDVGAITVCAQTWASWLEAEEKIAAEGSIVYGKTGPMPNPWVIISRNLQRDLRAWWAEFGLTPAARTRVKTQAAPDKKSTAIEAWHALKGGSA